MEDVHQSQKFPSAQQGYPFLLLEQAVRGIGLKSLRLSGTLGPHNPPGGEALALLPWNLKVLISSGWRLRDLSHCLSLALPSFPFSLDQHACLQQLINQTRLGPSFARSCIISSDKDYPGISVLAQANGQVTESCDLSAGHGSVQGTAGEQGAQTKAGPGI